VSLGWIKTPSAPKSARKNRRGDAGAIFCAPLRRCVAFSKYYGDPGTVPYANQEQYKVFSGPSKQSTDSSLADCRLLGSWVTNSAADSCLVGKWRLIPDRPPSCGQIAPTPLLAINPSECYATKDFPVLAYPEEAELAPSWAASVARDGKNEKNGSNRDGWIYNRRWPGDQNGNPGL